jgi:hypothetical protein
MASALGEFLSEAVRSGEALTIVYNGGSRPGEPRKVVPVSMTDTLLTCREPDTGAVKAFRIDRIVTAENPGGRRMLNDAQYANQEDAGSHFLFIEAVIQHYGEAFRAAGWNVESSLSSIAVGTYFKNGKPRKTPSIALTYVDPTIQTVLDVVSGQVQEVKRELTGTERPWRVDSWRFRRAKTFKDLEKATDVFVTEVHESSPDSAKTMFASH